ncbi:hypothetical protein DM867_02345 [Halosegnis rubeus]|uniref:DUF8103 domain-containing protein n=1 Tax=Halosegnis rubeus TaxID=2212850 RepID=A0A5N5UBH1_9EURY|nr:hypothetical protein [Halosegnis rubeus]KAB7516004.1 hypothetical protein DM867_02345 [Halosegnis rubeus]
MADSDLWGKSSINMEGEWLTSDAEISWLIGSALLQANQQTTRALEEHLYQLGYPDDDREVETYLRQALTEHRQIVENLELALEAVEQEYE